MAELSRSGSDRGASAPATPESARQGSAHLCDVGGQLHWQGERELQRQAALMLGLQ